MKKVSIRKFLIIILLVVNFAALIAFTLGAYKVSQHRKHFKGHGHKELFKDLSLSESQQKQAEIFHFEMRQDVRVYHKEVREINKQIVSVLTQGNESDHVKLDSLAMAVGVIHASTKSRTFGFLLQMRSICDDKQKQILNKHIRKSIKRVSHHPQRGNKNFNH